MQLNSIVFAAPKCSYSTNSLLKDLIYIPRCPSRWVRLPATTTTQTGSTNTSDSPNISSSLISDNNQQQPQPTSQQQLQLQSRAASSNQTMAGPPQRCKVTGLGGTIPCLFLDRQVPKPDNIVPPSRRQEQQSANRQPQGRGPSFSAEEDTVHVEENKNEEVVCSGTNSTLHQQQQMRKTSQQSSSLQEGGYTSSEHQSQQQEESKTAGGNNTTSSKTTTSNSQQTVTDDALRMPTMSQKRRTTTNSQQNNASQNSQKSSTNTNQLRKMNKKRSLQGPGKLVLYFHGNAEDLGMSYFLMSCLKRRLNVRVLAMEYPGYGLFGYEDKDSDKLLQDALTVFDFAVSVLKVREQDIFVFGRSIGCSVATYLAKNRDPSFCILMSPFKSLKQAAIAVVGSFLASIVAERLDNGEALKDVTAPVFIIHGMKDDFIPYSQAQALLECCTRSRFSYLLLPPEMTHNRFNVEEDLVKPLLKFLHKARLDLACRPSHQLHRRSATSETAVVGRGRRGSEHHPGFTRVSRLHEMLQNSNQNQPQVQLLSNDDRDDEIITNVDLDLLGQQSAGQGDKKQEQDEDPEEDLIVTKQLDLLQHDQQLINANDELDAKLLEFPQENLSGAIEETKDRIKFSLGQQSEKKRIAGVYEMNKACSNNEDQLSVGSENLSAQQPRRYDSFKITGSSSRRRMFSPLTVLPSQQPDIDNPFINKKDSHSNMTQNKKDHQEVENPHSQSNASCSSTPQPNTNNSSGAVQMEPSQPATLMENYFYPCDEVINFEKTLIKHSVVWDFALQHRSRPSQQQQQQQ